MNVKPQNHFNRFLIMWTGELISAIGSGLSAFALGVYAFHQTGLASSYSLITLVAFLPAFILRPLGGVLADRFNRRGLILAGDLGSALGIAFILCFIGSDGSATWPIYAGLALSSIFVAMQGPAYKASVSDFLPKEDYAKASGLIQLSSSAQFLIAPIVAGLLMTILDIRWVLVIDILSFLVAALAVFFVKKMELPAEPAESLPKPRLWTELQEGWQAITQHKGVLSLIIITSLILFYIGLLQTLLGPMVLASTDASTLGLVQSLCAIGMLVSSLFIGLAGNARNRPRRFAIALAAMGLMFASIGFPTNVWMILIPGFLFFFTVPFVNSSIEVMIRSNIDNAAQGRAWSLISVLTYIGAIVAYACSGFLADAVFNPLLVVGGPLASSFGRFFGVGPGRGIGLLFAMSGAIVMAIAVLVLRSKSIRSLDPGPVDPDRPSPDDRSPAEAD